MKLYRNQHWEVCALVCLQIIVTNNTYILDTIANNTYILDT